MKCVPGEMALQGDEAHERNRPVGVGGLHQLEQLGTLAADEVDIGRVTGQPQHQLIEEQMTAS